MLRKLGIFLVLFIFMVTLSGCATMHKQKDLEIQGLKNQVSALTAQLEEKDLEINELRASLDKLKEEKKQLFKKKVVGEVKSRPKVKQIQIALANAGYNPGRIDGRMGKQTRQAIRAFQKANNLVVDGKVGKQTWNLLRQYLYQKAK